ncbi:MAG: histidine phosphatase family protein [Acidimicrobiia bacterium]|nr:histidine phosphatase family protein [Acidimicrobiia bacterium]
MPRLYLVRHGKPTVTWEDTESPDPGLDQIGNAQAAQLAVQMAPLGPLPIIVSPLRRARETAEPLETQCGTPADVDPAVGELQRPKDLALDHGAWLGEVLSSNYGALGPEFAVFRDRIVGRLLALEADAIVVTHFVAINAAVGAATGNDAVISFAPGHCSITVIDVGNGRLDLVMLGETASTTVAPG